MSFADYMSQFSGVNESYTSGQISPVEYGNKLFEIQNLVFESEMDEREKKSLLDDIKRELDLL